MNRHQQVEVGSPWGIIEVDRGLTLFLANLWAQGVRTSYSCQGGPPYLRNEPPEAYLVFTDDLIYRGMGNAVSAGSLVVDAIHSLEGTITDVALNNEGSIVIAWRATATDD